MLNNQSLLQSVLLFFALLNPFLLSIYLLDLITDLDSRVLARVLTRASLIAGIVYWLFAWGGDAIFTDYLQLRFASFQLFGGIIFLLIGIRFVFSGVNAIRATRGAPEHLAGSIAMPFLIGPGTVSAAVVIGSRHDLLTAGLIIFGTLALTMTLVIALKLAHDYAKERNARLIDRYMEIVGRISALLIGTIAIEMILDGAGNWLHEIGVRP